MFEPIGPIVALVAVAVTTIVREWIQSRTDKLPGTLEASSDTSMRYYKGRWDEDRGDEFA